jgi:hypothetical protein
MWQGDIWCIMGNIVSQGIISCIHLDIVTEFRENQEESVRSFVSISRQRD